MIFKIKNIAIIAGILYLQSCSVALRDYQQSDPYALEQYRAALPTADSSSLADYAWQELFQDTILRTHIRTGLSKNLDIRVAQENIKIARSYLEQSKAAFLPAVSGELAYSYSKPSGEAATAFPGRPDLRDISLNASFSWEADIWGRLKSEKKAAIAAFFQTESFQQLLKSQLVAGIASTYYQLLSLDAKKEIIEQTITNREESLETIQALKESGDVTEVAVKQNEALLYTAQGLLVDVDNQIRLLENALSTLMGQVPDSIRRSKLVDQQLPDDLNTGVPVQLLSNRPDVLAAEYSLVNAFELSNVARASFYPRLSISGSGGLNSQNFGDLFSTNALFGNILSNLSQPIFNRRQLKTQEEVRLSEQEIALLDYQSSILTAYQEVSDGLYTYEANQRKLAIKELEADALSKAIEYSEELLNYGMADYLEVLTAKNNLLQTQLDLVDIELTRLTTTVDLYRALGGGWK